MRRPGPPGKMRGGKTRRLGIPPPASGQGRLAAIQSSIRSHQPKSQSIRSRPSGSLARGTCHQRITIRFVHRQLATRRRPWPCGPGRCARRGRRPPGAASRPRGKPPGRGARTWVIRSARSAIRSSPRRRSRSMAALTALRGEVPALGEDHEGVVRVQAGGQRRDLLLQSLPSPGFGAMNRAGCGRPARRSTGPRRACPEGPPGARGRTTPSACGSARRVPARRAGRAPGSAAQGGRPVPALGSRSAAAAPAAPRGRRPTSCPAPGRSGCPRSTASAARHPEAGRDPQTEHHHQQQRLAGQVDDRHPQDAQRAESARDDRRERGRHQQPHREGHPQQHPRGRPPPAPGPGGAAPRSRPPVHRVSSR